MGGVRETLPSCGGHGRGGQCKCRRPAPCAVIVDRGSDIGAAGREWLRSRRPLPWSRGCDAVLEAVVGVARRGGPASAPGSAAPGRRRLVYRGVQMCQADVARSGPRVGALAGLTSPPQSQRRHRLQGRLQATWKCPRETVTYIVIIGGWSDSIAARTFTRARVAPDIAACAPGTRPPRKSNPHDGRGIATHTSPCRRGQPDSA